MGTRLIKIVYDGEHLYYKEKRLKFEGQAQFSVLANMLEMANTAHHKNKYINLSIIPYSIKCLDDGYHLSWGDILSFGLGDEVK